MNTLEQRLVRPDEWIVLTAAEAARETWVECPGCAFLFARRHIDPDALSTCPCCEEARLTAALNTLPAAGEED